MKHVCTIHGKVGVLVPFQEVSPIAGVYLPNVSSAIAERYFFTGFPSFTPEALEKSGVEFRMGKFQASQDDERNVQSLNLYSDGILATCYSTEDAALLTADLLHWLGVTFSFRVSDLLGRPDKMYFLSTVIVEFEASVANGLSKFEPLFGEASQMLKARYGLDRPTAFRSLSFHFDTTGVTGPLSNSSAFLIERQNNQPFESNRFYSQAPISTTEHLALLEHFESILRD